MSGEWKHRALQELLGPEFSCEEEVEWNGIKAHPDAIWKPNGVPTCVIEIKTTNSAGVSRKPYLSHLKQLKSYLSILDLSFGKLFYMYLGTNLDKVFYEYSITMTKEKRKEMQDELIASASKLRLGIALKDLSIVSHVAESPEYLNRFGRNWMCEDYCVGCATNFSVYSFVQGNQHHLYKYLVASSAPKTSRTDK